MRGFFGDLLCECQSITLHEFALTTPDSVFEVTGLLVICVDCEATFNESADMDVRPTRTGFGVAARAVIVSPAALRYALGLRSTLREFAPELIHSNGAKMHLLAAIASP